MFVRKDTHTLNFCSLSPSCLVNGFTMIPSPGLLIPPVFMRKKKDSLVAHSSGSIKFLHNLYLNSKQAIDLACHQEFEGFDLPGISIAINIIPWKKIIVLFSSIKMFSFLPSPRIEQQAAAFGTELASRVAR